MNAGSQGPVGAPGTNGAQGPSGLTGATGTRGSTGYQGQPGATGQQGYQGSMGQPGPIGATGFQGMYSLVYNFVIYKAGINVQNCDATNCYFLITDQISNRLVRSIGLTSRKHL